MINSGAYMHSMYKTAVALGDKAVVSDAYFEIKGHEDIAILIKQFPWPELSSAGEIEVPLPNGGAHWQPQQIKTNQQGQVGFMETREGHISRFLEEVINAGGKFDAVVYEGTPDDYTRKANIYGCFLQMDNPDRDFESRGQILLITGTLFFHYYGADA
jgi:hypothetical protein